MWAAKRGAAREDGARDGDRDAAPLQRAARALGVPADAALRAALLAAAAAGVASDPAFATRVRAALGAGTDQRAEAPATADAAPPPASSARRGARPAPRLVPIARVEQAVLDPFGPPDPLYLYRLYGAAQLPAALAQYSYATLKEA
ncbi:MAG TPA: hypothetical protein VFY89_05470, partial [Ktedonobacterales bacterium]